MVKALRVVGKSGEGLTRECVQSDHCYRRSCSRGLVRYAWRTTRELGANSVLYQLDEYVLAQIVQLSFELE